VKSPSILREFHRAQRAHERATHTDVSAYRIASTLWREPDERLALEQITVGIVCAPPLSSELMKAIKP
jgi:hypothetical protein